MGKFSTGAMTAGLYFLLYGIVFSYGINNPGVLPVTIGASLIIGICFLYSILKLNRFEWGEDLASELGLIGVVFALIGGGYAFFSSITTSPSQPYPLTAFQIIQGTCIFVFVIGLPILGFFQISLSEKRVWLGQLNCWILGLITGIIGFGGFLVGPIESAILPSPTPLEWLIIAGVVILAVGLGVALYEDA